MPEAALIQDSFTDIDGTLLSDHTSEIGGKWAVGTTYYILANHAVGAGGGGSGDIFHTTIASQVEGYAQVRLITSASETTFTMYMNMGVPGQVYDSLLIEVWSNNFYLDDVLLPGIVFISGAIYKIKRVGNVVSLYINGVLKGSVSREISVGRKFGFNIYCPTEEAYLDDYEAGEIIPAVAAVDHLMLMGVH